jgi:hypothetical protein
MNKLVMFFDPIDIANHVSEFNPFPECLIFNNWADAADWFKRNDCHYEEDYKSLGVFTIKRFGKTLSGRYLWGKAFL